MKLILLIVLFSTPENPQPHEEHGFGPRPAASLEQCLKWRSATQDYLDEHVDSHVFVHAACVEFEARGYEEAEEALIRKSGIPG